MNTTTTSRSNGPDSDLRRTGVTRPVLPVLLALALVAFAFAVPQVHAQADRGYDRGYDSGTDRGYDSGTDRGTDLGYDGSYSYVRVLDGSATVILAGDSGRDQAELNQPILTGDHLWVAPRSRAEVLLSDGNVMRLDGDSEAAFDRLAFSPDGDDRSTALGLRQGNAQIVVVDDALGDELPRIETPNATVFLNQAGTYRLTTLGGDWTEVVVRSGSAEVVTDRGSETAERGESVVVDGASNPRSSVRRAGDVDGLERWGNGLDRQVPDVPYVDDSLRYAAAPLSDYGRWTDVGGNWGWRPSVGADWRPYWRGRWASTRAGLTWVSSEPWGWVPYHYGTWDYVPGYGWVWFPGNRFATAWVYWYWGPSYVAWVPVGYYTRHYYPHYRSGFRFGVYGWAGGDWDFFSDWTFCSTGYFGHRYQNRYLYSGRDWRRHGGPDRVPRGIITTDTRGVTPERWHKPNEVMNVLRTRPSAGIRAGGDLPDVSTFVARRDDLPPTVRRRVLLGDGEGRKLAGSPLAPGKAGGTGVRDDKPRVARLRSAPSGGVKGGVSGKPDDAAPRTRTIERPRGRDDKGTETGTGGDSGRAVVRVRPTAPAETPNRVRSNAPVERARPVDRDEVKDRGDRGDRGNADRGGRPVVRSRPDAGGSDTPSEAPRERATRREPEAQKEPEARKEPEPRREPEARPESKPDEPAGRDSSKDRHDAVRSRPDPGRSSATLRRSETRASAPSAARRSAPAPTSRSASSTSSSARERTGSAPAAPRSSAGRPSAERSSEVRRPVPSAGTASRGAGGSYSRPAPRASAPPARSSQPPARSSRPSARASQPPARSSQPSARASQPPARSSQPSARGSQGSAGHGGGSSSRGGGSKGSARQSQKPRKPHGG